jgi:hypothetical protein
MMETNIDDKLIEFNDLFDEMIEDAQSFARDITFSIHYLPYASIAFLSIGIVAFYIGFFLMNPSGVSFYINKGLGIVALVSGGLVAVIILQRYYGLKKKYARLFELVEELKLKKVK